MDIDPTLVTEHTELVELAEVLRTMVSFASDKNKAAKEARKYINVPDQLSL